MPQSNEGYKRPSIEPVQQREIPQWLASHLQVIANRKAEEAQMARHPVRRIATYALDTAIESIPFGIGPWGIGDIATGIEALAGRTIDGIHLSGLERLIYVAASFIPVVPGRPLITAYRALDQDLITPMLLDIFARPVGTPARRPAGLPASFQQALAPLTARR